MKKLLFIIMLATFSMAIAREFYVEKAINVKLKTGEIVKAAQRLDEKAEIVIESGGRLMFVDQQSKNRWLVQKKYKGKIGKLAKKKKRGLVEQSLSYVKSLFSDEKSDGQTSGVVMRGRGDVDILEEWDEDSTINVDYTIGLTPDSIRYYIVK